MTVVLGPTWAYEQRDKLVTLEWSGLWDVISLQTLCWEKGDKGHEICDYCCRTSNVLLSHCKIVYTVFSQPSIYIDGWLYMPWAWRLSSVTFRCCLKTIPHSVFTTWKWHPFATWTPSFIILVWGHHPLIGAKAFACLQNSVADKPYSL